MSLKQKLIAGYFGIGVLVALYLTFFGQDRFHGFAYNLGKGIVWPAVMFPSLGRLIGGLIWIAVIVIITLFVRAKKE